MDEMMTCSLGKARQALLNFQGSSTREWRTAYTQVNFNDGPGNDGLTIGVIGEIGYCEDANYLNDGDEKAEPDEAGKGDL